MKFKFPKIKREAYPAIIIVGFLALIIPTHFSHANWFTSFALDQVASAIFSIIQSIITGLTAVIIKIFNYTFYVRAYNDIPVITATWKILRDFANMLFIVFLVYMAFATIFNIQKWRFEKLIVKFLIVAVLINFSLVIGGLVIDGCQVLTNIFLSSIGNPGDRLGQYLNPAALFAQTGSVWTGDIGASEGISLILSVIIGAVFMFSLLVATVFGIIRIFIVWGLLIISPLAWMTHMLPSDKTFFKKWWSWFLGWNLFTPIYLFFLYIGLVFLAQRDVIIDKVVQVNANDPLILGTHSLTFNLVFFYLFSAFIIASATAWAIMITKNFGSHFDKGVDWAKTFVKRIPLPGGGSLDSYEYGFNKRKEQFQKQGFQNRFLNKIYGGQEGLEKRRANVAGSWPFKTQRQFTESAKTTYENAKRDYDTGRINFEDLKKQSLNKSAASAEGYAYRKLLVEKGGMDGVMFQETLQQLKGNPYAVNDFIKSAKENKFEGIKNLKGVALNDSLNHPALTPGRREILKYIANDAKMSSGVKLEDMDKIGTILGGVKSPEAKKFLDDFSKVRPDIVYEYKLKNSILDQPEPEKDEAGNIKLDENGKPLYKVGPKTVAQTKVGAVRKALDTEPKNIAAMPEDLWKTPEFKASLYHKLRDFPDQKVSKKTRRNIRENLEKILTEKGESEKIAILEEQAPKRLFQTPQGGGGDEEENDGQDNPDNQTQQQGNNPPQPNTATVSYRSGNINKNNIVDLRNKPKDDRTSLL